MIKQLTDLIIKFPDLDIIGFDPRKDGLSMTKLKEAISKTVFPNYKKKFETPGWLKEPLQDLRLEEESDFWNAHNFNNYIDKIKTPIMLIASRDDKVVQSKQNAIFLSEKYNDFAINRSLKKQDYQVRFLDLKSGSHCQIHSGYGWGVASTLINSWVLYNSPEFLEKKKSHTVLIPESIIPSIEYKNRAALTRFRGLQWEAIENKEYARLHMYFTQYTRNDRKTSFYSLKYKVPYSLLKLKNETPPASQLEAQIFTRWLNARVQVWGDHLGDPFLGKNGKRPKYFNITEY